MIADRALDRWGRTQESSSVWTKYGSRQVEANRALIERVYDEALSDGNIDAVRELFALPFIYHELGWPSGERSLEAVLMLINRDRNDFKDLRYIPHPKMVEEDLVIAHWSAVGTATFDIIKGGEPFYALQGQQVIWRGTTVWRIKAGKVAEAWTTHASQKAPR